MTVDGSNSPWITALRRSHERLASVAAALTPEQLRGPSVDTDWTVAQVLSHIGSGAEIMAAVLGAALEPDGKLDPATMFVPVWDVWNARSPEEQAAESVPADDASIRRFEALSADDIARSHLNFAGTDLDAEGIARLRLSEHALHTWDVAASVDPSATVDPGAVELLVDTLPWLAAHAGQPAGTALRVEIRATAPDRRFLLAVDDAVELEARPAGDSAPADGATATLTLPSETLILLVYGRLRADRGAVVESSTADSWPQLDDIRQVFPGF